MSYKILTLSSNRKFPIKFFEKLLVLLEVISESLKKKYNNSYNYNLLNILTSFHITSTLSLPSKKLYLL